MLQMRPMLWCRIDREAEHSLLGKLQLVKRDEVIRELETNAAVESMEDIDLDHLLPHLSLYTETAQDLERAMAAATGGRA